MEEPSLLLSQTNSYSSTLNLISILKCCCYPGLNLDSHCASYKTLMVQVAHILMALPTHPPLSLAPASLLNIDIDYLYLSCRHLTLHISKLNALFTSLIPQTLSSLLAKLEQE